MSAKTSSKDSARRYVKALFDLAVDERAVEAVEADMLALRDMLDDHAEFRQFVHNPLLSRKTKVEAMDSLLVKGKAHAVTRRFMTVLARNQRLPILGDVIELFIARLAESRGEIAAEVISAEELKKDQIAAIESSLKKATGSDTMTLEWADFWICGT